MVQSGCSAQDDVLVGLERTTGMTTGIVKRTFSGANQFKYPMELEKLIKEVHSCSTSLIILENMANYAVELGHFSERMVTHLESLYSRAGTSSTTPKHMALILNQISHLASRNDLTRTRLQSLLARAQSQTWVVFSLISQRDSDTNIAVASASKSLAEATTRDSRAMRTIAVMTLIFLPSTLISSIFSTSAFDLRASDTQSGEQGSPSGIVAPLWWIWAVVSIALTILVLLVWAIWNRGRNIASKRQDAPLEPSKVSS
ncbi:MAG: hypothetical protein M1828_005783 [Chrysothrix sp. TS-e1954]|nr:MAG: hypothetical protein M1828_005783 [Chrysothrix sp. TS-e1954]